MDGAGGWVTQRDAARRLGCGTSTVKALLNRGDLERRPLPRDRTQPSISAESVERLRPVLEQQRDEREERRRHRESWHRPPDDGQVWLDTAELAAVCGMGWAWAKKQIQLERVPATMHGGKWWVRRGHAEVVAAARAFGRRMGDN